MRCCIVIPARLASTRLPEKLLLRETGRSVLEHTYLSASQARKVEAIIVAVDHERLLAEVQSFGGRGEMTNPLAQCGTERVAEVAARHPDIDVWINVQGDEPEIEAEAVERVVDLLAEHPDASVATLATPIRNRRHLEDPSCVKVVCDLRGRALYFSRSPIPHPRTWDESLLLAEPPLFQQHIGIYGYRKSFLQQLVDLPASPLEQTEKLEQLRFLQAGHAIVVGRLENAPRGIDTREDYDAFVVRCRSSG
jgi:3-deoxy-manno-octulosonate cytidylyltransferase (CMP-KDO synthetase)